MAKSKFNRGIKALDTVFIEDPRRAIVIGAFIVIAIVLVVIFWNRLKNLFSEFRANRASSSVLNQYTSETGESPTMINANFYQYAQQLYNAFNPHTFGWGTDEDTVYAVMGAMNNTADVYKLIKEFGIRDGKDLKTYMRSELSSKELRKVNAILAGKGITYTF